MANARDRRAAWAVAILVLLVLFLVLNRCAGSNGSTRVGAVPNGDGPAEPAPAPTAPLEPGTDDADQRTTELTTQRDPTGARRHRPPPPMKLRRVRPRIRRSRRSPW